MKKLLIALAGLLAILVVAVFAVPALIDWNGFKPRIAAAVKEATGRDFEIAGNLEVALLPEIRFSVEGLRLANAPGAAEPDMLRVAGLQGRLALLPLIAGGLDVRELSVTGLSAILEVDAEGRANWRFQPTQAAGGEPARGDREGGRDGGRSRLSGLVLRDVRVSNAAITYRDAVTGQDLEVREFDLTVALSAADDPLQVAGEMRVNAEPVTLALSLATPAALQAGEPARVEAKINSTRAEAGFAGAVRRGAVVSLDGTLSAEIESVGKLLTWLDRPLAPGHPDPGALALTAVFSGDAETMVLDRAEVSGDGLALTATGRFAERQAGTEVALTVEGGTLDLLRYLPPPRETRAPAQARASQRWGDRPAPPPGPRRSPFARFSDQPLDLSGLQRLTADVRVSLQGLKAPGLEFGPLDLMAEVRDGRVDAELRRLEMPGGQASAVLRASAVQSGLEAEFSVDLQASDSAALGQAVGLAGDLASGAGRLRLRGAVEGSSPRALAESAEATLTATLDRLQYAGAAALSGVDARAALAGAQGNATLRVAGQVRAAGAAQAAPLELQTELGALARALAGDSVPLDLRLQLADHALSLNGEVADLPTLPRPNVKLRMAGPSLAELANLLGVSVAESGAYDLRADLSAADKRYRLAPLDFKLGTTAVAGEAELSLAGERPVRRVTLRAPLIDLAALSVRDPGGPAGRTGRQPGPPRQDDPSPYLIPDTPLPLGVLRNQDAELSAEVGKLRLPNGVELDDIAITAKLENDRLLVEPLRASLFEGSLDARVELDAGPDVPTLVTRVELEEFDYGLLLNQLQVTKLMRGAVNANANLAGQGDSPRAIASTLGGLVEVAGGEGALDRSVFAAIASELDDAFSPLFDRQRTVVLKCIVLDLPVADGVVSSRVQLLDTSAFAVNGKGKIDLRKERFKLTYDTATHESSLLSLAVPVDVTGTLRDPDVQPNVRGAAIGAAKGAAALLNPLIATGAIVGGNQALADPNPCVAALQGRTAPQRPGPAAAATEDGAAQQPAAAPETRQESGDTGDQLRELGDSIGKRLKGLFGD